jgi:hypothetical protein
MLFDMMKDAEHKAGVATPPLEPRRLDAADKEVLQLFIERLRRKSSPRSRHRRPRRQWRRKPLMTDGQLTAQLHELKRHNEAPIALIEMLDALLSLDPSLTAKQKRKRSYEIMASAQKQTDDSHLITSTPRSGGPSSG